MAPSMTMVLLLGVLWAFAVLRFLGAGAWGNALATIDEAPPQGEGLVSSNAAEADWLLRNATDCHPGG